MEGMEIVPIEKVADTIKDAQELKDSIEEIKVFVIHTVCACCFQLSLAA